MSDSISIGSVVNNGGLNNTGKIEIGGDQVLNAGSAGDVTPEALFSAIAKAVPAGVRDQIEQQVIAPLSEELDNLKALSAEQQESEKKTIVQKLSALVSPLQPYAAEIAKAVLAFTEVSLSALPAPTGWFVAGTLAAIRALNTKAT